MHKSNMFRLLKNQKGQALLIIVLVLVVALTVGLSVVSRSIINLKNSQDQASSQKALSAAEAGIEQAIRSQNQTKLAGGFYAEGGSTNYETTISSISGTVQFLVHGNNNQINLVKKGNPAYVWTTNYSASSPWADPWSGTLTISWGDSNDPCKTAALEVSVISKDPAGPNPILQKFAYDPCSMINGGSIDRYSSNGFSNAVSKTSPFTNPKLFYSVALNNNTPINNIYLVSVNPLYADTHIGITSQNSVVGKSLPYQGADISSKGTDSQVQRRAFVFQGFPQIPAELFPYTIFSP